MNAGYASGCTPLVKAATNGHDKCVAHLINAGADLSKSGSRALIIAAQDGHVKCVEQLIQSGVDVNSQDKERDNIFNECYSTWKRPVCDSTDRSRS